MPYSNSDLFAGPINTHTHILQINSFKVLLWFCCSIHIFLPKIIIILFVDLKVLKPSMAINGRYGAHYSNI